LSGDAPLKEAAIERVELLLRWVTLRFFDTNTTVNRRCLDFLKALFQMLVAENYKMSDCEANAFLPYLVAKVNCTLSRHGRNFFCSKYSKGY